MRIIPELYLSIGVQFRVVLHSFHGNSDGAGARVSAEFVVSLPRNEQSHLEGASIDKRPKLLQHQQNKCLEQRRPPHLLVLSPPMSPFGVKVRRFNLRFQTSTPTRIQRLQKVRNKCTASYIPAQRMTSWVTCKPASISVARRIERRTSLAACGEQYPRDDNAG